MNKKPDSATVERLRPFIDAVQQAYRKKREAEEVHYRAEQALKRAVGPDHDFTNEACRVNKIGGHIYDNTSAPRGVGHRNCILCGTDDFDF